MKDGTCSKKFPKPFSDSTVINEACFPAYRRRSPLNGGYTGIKKVRGTDIIIDNRWVVPYSPYLLHKY